MKVVALGSFGVHTPAAAVPTGEVARRVLAVLTARVNQPVPPDLVTELVWSGARRRGHNTLQAHVSRWRKALGPGRISHGPGGYTLRLEEHEFDVLEFERWADEALRARESGDTITAAQRSDRALALWQGAPFGTLAGEECVRARHADLTALHSALHLARLELWCEVGDHDRTVQVASGLAADAPWDEPLHRVLARAHYGRGDQVAALQVIADLEGALRRDLGLDLAPASHRLREQVLRQEPAPAPVPQPGGRPVEVVRTAGRVAELPESHRRLLGAAALAGSEVDPALLGRALELDGPTLVRSLAVLARGGLLRPSAEGVRFGAGVSAEAVLDLLPADVVLDLHRRLAQVLLGRGGPDQRSRAAGHLAEAAALGSAVAVEAVRLDLALAREALAGARFGEAVRHARRARVSSGYLDGQHGAGADRAECWWIQGEALRRVGDLTAAMAAHRAAVLTPGVATGTLVDSALAHEECSLHARRPRHGTHDDSVLLLERALEALAPDAPVRAEVGAALAQAWAFAGHDSRAVQVAGEAVTAARTVPDRGVLARTLLRSQAVRDPVREARERFDLAREAALVAAGAGADDLELEALSAWVPEIMKVSALVAAEETVARVEKLSERAGHRVHRCRVPMWRAALALEARRFDEAEVLVEEFRRTGEQDGYADTARVHGFQSILVSLGRGQPDRAAQLLDSFAHDRAFEPWVATAVLVAHAQGDSNRVRQLLLPWSARRFTLSRPFAGVQTFCAALAAPAVAAQGDPVSCSRLADLVEPALGHRLVLGSGAAVIGDLADRAALLRGRAAEADQRPLTRSLDVSTG